MKYKLMLSMDCGMSYNCAHTSDDLAELAEKGKEYNKQILRWCIVDEKGELVDVSAIHKGIVEFMARVRTNE